MKNIAIIPARSGSKGLRNKNIKLLNGKPLMAYSIEAALNSNLFDTVIVSTDSEEYAEIAKKYGAEVPFLREEKTSSDLASSWDVVLEVLQYFFKQQIRYETICLLQPTSPLRGTTDIRNAYKLFIDKCADSIVSVVSSEHPLEYYYAIEQDLSIGNPLIKSKETIRQNMELFYRINGAIYIRKVNYLKERIILANEKKFAYIMNRFKSIDIDCEDDFIVAEKYMEIL